MYNMFYIKYKYFYSTSLNLQHIEKNFSNTNYTSKWCISHIIYKYFFAHWTVFEHFDEIWFRDLHKVAIMTGHKWIPSRKI